MQAERVARHWREVRDREYEQVTQSGNELLQKAVGLSATRQTLKLVMTEKPDAPLYLPSLGNVLFFDTYYDALLLKQAKKSPRQALAFLRDAVMPMSSVKPAAADVRGTLIDSGVGMCLDAEAYFVGCLTQINTGKYKGQEQISVYHNAQGTPLALRKKHEASSSLLLKPIAIGDAIAPAGSLATIGITTPATRTGKVYQSSGAMLSTYLVDEPLELSPGRLSPWAYDEPLDRSLHALDQFRRGGEELHYDRARGRIVEGHTLDDFRQAAERVMEMCGVSQ